jgi:phosphotriesterase-related protein
VMLSHDKASFIDYWTGAEIDKVMPDWQYTYITSGVLPGLRDRGVPEEEIEQMLVRNPREFFAQGA